jgi:hypothetical protein
MMRRSHSGAVCVNAWCLYGFQSRVPTCRGRAAAGTGKRPAGDVAAAGTGKRHAAAGTGKRHAGDVTAAGTGNKCVPRVP